MTGRGSGFGGLADCNAGSLVKSVRLGKNSGLTDTTSMGALLDIATGCGSALLMSESMAADTPLINVENPDALAGESDGSDGIPEFGLDLGEFVSTAPSAESKPTHRSNPQTG